MLPLLPYVSKIGLNGFTSTVMSINVERALMYPVFSSDVLACTLGVRTLSARNNVGSMEPVSIPTSP